MKEKLLNIGIMLLLVSVTEIGLGVSVYDAASRKFDTIAGISSVVFFLFPLTIILGFIKSYVKTGIYISFSVATFVIAYMSSVYGLKVFSGDMIGLVLVYVLVVGISLYFLFFRKTPSKHS